MTEILGLAGAQPGTLFTLPLSMSLGLLRAFYCVVSVVPQETGGEWAFQEKQVENTWLLRVTVLYWLQSWFLSEECQRIWRYVLKMSWNGITVFLGYEREVEERVELKREPKEERAKIRGKEERVSCIVDCSWLMRLHLKCLLLKLWLVLSFTFPLSWLLKLTSLQTLQN